ncbi:MAG: iron-containing alcohol dehydrogenase [Clostridia bacterium]|nr:iron-containing alcohol dehydrogenase [Clostridia bacterium]
MLSFNYSIPTKIIFGPGKIKELATEKLFGKKALIVISSGTSMKKNGYLDQVIELLSKQGIESTVFDKILPNPVKTHVMEGALLARKAKCDFVIGLGGGSSIDSAKSIAVMATNEGDYWDYISGGTGKGLEVPNKPLPIVAITTTAGTGTEADPWTVITKEETNEKIGFGYEETFPRLSIVDPELMLSVPRNLTIYQGFDAFFHAAEGVIANISTPVSDLFALKSIELINKSLPEAAKNGNNLEARTDVALANTLSGLVESTSSCVSEHSMEHALSAYHPNLPHGAGLILLSEAYFSFFSDKAPEQFKKIAKAMGKEEKPENVVKAIHELKVRCQVENMKLADFGIQYDEMEKFAKNAFDTMGGLFNLDRYKLSLEEVIKIYQAAY